jgi:hypothetical protein
VELAHFTPTEIPGTLAVLALGLCLGALLAKRLGRSPLMVVALASLAVFAIAGYCGDQLGWSEPVRTAIDGAFLALAVLLIALAARLPRAAAPSSWS